MLKPYQRNLEGSRVSYDVLSSKRTFYYTVQMLGLTALSCECDRFVKGHAHCSHMTTAETAEAEFQQSAQLPTVSISTDPKEIDADKRATAPLNGNKPFSMLR